MEDKFTAANRAHFLRQLSPRKACVLSPLEQQQLDQINEQAQDIRAQQILIDELNDEIALCEAKKLRTAELKALSAQLNADIKDAETLSRPFDFRVHPIPKHTITSSTQTDTVQFSQRLVKQVSNIEQMIKQIHQQLQRLNTSACARAKYYEKKLLSTTSSRVTSAKKIVLPDPLEDSYRLILQWSAELDRFGQEVERLGIE